MEQQNKLESESIYELAVLTRTILLNMSSIGENLTEVINKVISSKYEGKCVVEGYIKPGSIKIVSYSSGLITGENVFFEVILQCEICYPVEGMIIQCVAKNITKAGIRAISANEKDEENSPFIVFIARDHHNMNDQFQSIQEGTRFTAKVIGQRFELNDKYISIIAELSKPKLKKR
jgi:DNA-directed RNA polymerase subunit E'/Rpb7